LRITAPITTIPGLPRAVSRSAYALHAGHHRIAVTAGKNNALRMPAFPCFDKRDLRLTDVPD
jgi:hypothetical protein